MPFLSRLLALALAATLAPAALWAQDAPRTEPAALAAEFLGLVQQLNGDPAAREAVEKAVGERHAAAAGKAQELAPEVDRLNGEVAAQSQALDAATQERAALEEKLKAVTEQQATAQAALDAAKAQQTDVTNRKAAAEAEASSLEWAAKLLSALKGEAPAAPEAAPAPPATPAPVAAQPPSPAAPPAPAPEAPNAAPASFTPGGPDFNRDVSPILSEHCFACHGPDEKQRKASFRLDTAEGAFAALKDGAHAIVPGDSANSVLVERILQEDADERMPPVKFDKPLTQAMKDTLVSWIDHGAEWQRHWSFIAPQKSPEPAVSNAAWVKNPIDAFILARLDKEGLAPSPEAEKRALIRRVTLDLTGLPPTPADVEAFVADGAPDAYERVVDRLMAAPEYGEHMTRYWLDLSRYADTNGYHIDNERYMWRWRDWVINAFNQNMPFDEFTVEQVAGDLLPSPSQDQLIATGFHRNHMINFEGGAIPEEYHMQYVVDRVNTTSEVWLGLTVGCAQCHDHKYDPISQKEFYKFFAFFNSVEEQGLDGRDGNSTPFMKAPLPVHERGLKHYDEGIAIVRAALNTPRPELDAAQTAWEADWRTRHHDTWQTLAPESMTAEDGVVFTPQEDGSILVSGANPDQSTYEITAKVDLKSITAIRLEALMDPSLGGGSTGRSSNGNFVLSEFEFEAGPSTNVGLLKPVEVAAANADYSQPEHPIANTIDQKPETGWGVGGHERKESRVAMFSLERAVGFDEGTMVRIRLKHTSQFAQHSIGRFRLSVTSDTAMTPSRLGSWYVSGPFKAYDGKAAYETAFEPETSLDLEATYEDGRYKWVKSIPSYADGKIHRLSGSVAATYLYREINAPSAREMTLALGSNDAIKVWLNGLVVHDNNVQRGIERDQDRVVVQLNEGKNDLLMKVVNYGNDYAFSFRRSDEQVGVLPVEIEAVLTKAPEARSPEEQNQLREYYRRLNSPEWRAQAEKLSKLTADRAAFEKTIPTTMVMREMAVPRETHIMLRGQYDQPGEAVEPGLPAALPPLPEGLKADRLGLAKWLVSPENPLTPRVIVNRYWARYFGTGIVKTVEDFGAQGEWPSHPELLDWMAREFVDSGWDMKHMHRLIVTSAAYRQSSIVSPALLELDPQNRLLARGPRFRMDAEMIRDNALAISGLLVEKLGGPSVKPPQPEGIWEEVAYGGGFTAQRFMQDQGEALYRRSMYTFWKRQAPPPNMMVLDAPNREVCTARRARTNTPLQALALLNGPQFVEAARFLAERMMTEASGEPAQRIAYAFELATARPPSDEETAVLLNLYTAQCADFSADPEAAKALLTVGDTPPSPALDPVELASWAIVANTILNLDETITKI